MAAQSRNVAHSNRWACWGVLVLLALIMVSTSVHAKTKLTVGTFISASEWKDTYGEMAAFENANPDVELDVVNIANHVEYGAKIAVLAATGDIPDVLQVPPEQVAPIVYAGVLEDLEPWITRDKTLDIKPWLPGALEAVRFQGITFGIPAYVVNYTYAYNQDILAERGVVPPRADEWVTWDRIRDIGKRSSKDTNGDGVPDIWGFFHGNSYTELLPIIFQAGGRVFDNNMMLDIDRPSTYEAINWLISLIKSNIHGGSRGGFYEGTVATMRMGSWEMDNIIKAKTPLGVASGIQYKTKGEVAYVTSYTMSASSKNKDAAWRYLKFLTSKEAQKFVVGRGRVPMRRDVQLPMERKEVLTGLINSLGTAQSYPYHVHSNYIQMTINNGMARVWNDSATPETVIPELQRTINAYLQQNK